MSAPAATAVITPARQLVSVPVPRRASTCGFDHLAEPDCCTMPDGEHDRYCPPALAVACADCGSGPGFEHEPYCPSTCRDTSNTGPAPAELGVLVIVAAGGPAALWHRVVDLLHPLKTAGACSAYIRDGQAHRDWYPLTPPRAHNADARYTGWIDSGGLTIAARPGATLLTPARVLAARDLRPATLTCSAAGLVAVPVRLLLHQAAPAGEPDVVCRCGHAAASHEGVPGARDECLHTTPGGTYCTCLAFRATR